MEKKVLVVDDSPTIRSMAKMILQNGGYEVLTAKDGQKGLNIVSSEQLDLIITDVNMPVMDGVEFTKQVRNGNTPNKALPILVVTTEAGDKVKLSGKVAGASGWLVKPFDPDRLLRAVNKLLSGA